MQNVNTPTQYQNIMKRCPIYQHNKYHLVMVGRDRQVEESALTSWEIQTPNAQSIDWIMLEGVLSKWSRYEKGKSVKCIHELWDTTNQKKDCGLLKSPKCPLCEEEDETTDQVLWFCHPIMAKARSDTLQDLCEKVFQGTNINVARWITVMTHQWLQSYPPSLPPKQTPYKCIRKTIINQHKLGIQNMFQGLLSVRWRKVQEIYFKKCLMTM